MLTPYLESLSALLAEYPINPEPSLAFLVSKGELCFADLVFPTVVSSRDNNILWVGFTYQHYPDIFWVTGHTNMGQFKTSVDYPVHLNVWYKNNDRATDLVKKLVRLLEATSQTQGN